MKVTTLAIPDVLLIQPRTFTDERGYFLETWQSDRYTEAGIAQPFVQDNLSFSRRSILRGLHFQWPRSQGKLVSVLQGAVFDVAVDVRRGSPTFGTWVGQELSAENHRQMWVPEGFAHGFVVLSECALFAYKVTAPYVREDEVTIAFDDPSLAIAWPGDRHVLSPKDAAAARLANIPLERLPAFEVAR
jgi:dTDP-4-dehydrorhamnose 3,5-epimerase